MAYSRPFSIHFEEKKFVINSWIRTQILNSWNIARNENVKKEHFVCVIQVSLNCPLECCTESRFN